MARRRFSRSANNRGSQTAATSAFTAADMPSQPSRLTKVTGHRGCMPTSARPVASVSSLL